MKRLFLVDQNADGLKGQYLTEVLLVATTAKRAIAGALQLRRDWNVVVCKELLHVFDLGPAPDPLPEGLIPRHQWDGIDFLAIGTGVDDS